MTKKRLILLDVHAIVHRAYHALPEFATSKGEPTGALYGLVAMLIKLIDELKPHFLVACFDLPGPTHRHVAYETYKAGRAKTDDNLVRQLERAKDIFTVFGIPIYAHPGFEADDIIGTIVYELDKREDIEIIIASGDMDALQLVRDKKVQVYTLKRGINDTILYDEKKVLERFGFQPKLLVDYKGLRGDPSDNITGVRGIGEKTAASLVALLGTLENIYKALKKGEDQYKKAGVSERIKNLLIENEKEAFFSRDLAVIRSDAPIHFVLPPEWRQNLDVAKLLDLFRELEFRTMGERVKQLLKIEQNSNLEVQLPSGEVGLPNSKQVKELCLALWVIDSNLTSPTLEEVFRFTKTDSVEKAKKVIASELDKRKVRKVFEEIEKPIMRVVEQMNERGVKIDKKVLQKLGAKYRKELSSLEKKIWKEAGGEFNINSPKVLSEILFTRLDLAGKNQKKTPTGILSTREAELEKLRGKHPIVGLILEYRELSKLLSTYIDAIVPLLDKSSRLHSTFLQAGTTTGRMASNNPNLQNIPNKTALGRAIRHAFVAEVGFKLVSLDYSQIELRVAAMLSGDEKLIEIFKNGEDIHAGVAMRVFKVPRESVDKNMRARAKTINFGILYGMGVNALRANLNTDHKEAEDFYRQYFETFSGLALYLNKIKNEVRRQGYTETLFGRRRYFTEIKSPLPYVRAQAERMAINAPIQGTQADLIKIAMKKIDEHIKSEGHEHDAHLVLQVHDELVYEVKDSLVSEAARHFKQLMETVLPEDKTLEVPIIAEVYVGENWGEMRSV